MREERHTYKNKDIQPILFLLVLSSEFPLYEAKTLLPQNYPFGLVWPCRNPLICTFDYLNMVVMIDTLYDLIVKKLILAS
jgi:hypothetical protein